MLSARDEQSSERSSAWFNKDGSSSPDEAPSSSPPTNGAANAVVLLLMLATFNQWARALIFYVVDFKTATTDEAARLFMNVDIGFDAAQYGILASIGFAALFSLTSLVAGGLVDRYDTRNLCAEFARVVLNFAGGTAGSERSAHLPTSASPSLTLTYEPRLDTASHAQTHRHVGSLVGCNHRPRRGPELPSGAWCADGILNRAGIH